MLIRTDLTPTDPGPGRPGPATGPPDGPDRPDLIQWTRPAGACSATE